MNEELKELNNDLDYKLMFLKTNRYDYSFEHFSCQWFKCGLSFDSEIALNQHIKSTHFEITEELDYSPLIPNTLNEIIIKCEPELNEKKR